MANDPGRRPPSGGPDPVPPIDPHGITLGVPTERILLPTTPPAGIVIPEHATQVQEALDRHVPIEWQGVVRQALPLLVSLARVAFEIYEEVHHAERPPQP
jgi:hypothetical protein